MQVIAFLPLIIKALSTALLVVCASALAETLGPFWGALIASLPISAGPAYVFLAMQHDGAFVAASALSSAAANVATGLFLIVHALLARRMSMGRSLGVAVAAWLAANLVIRQVPFTPATVALLNLTVYGIGFVLLRGLEQAVAGPPLVTIRRWFDLPVRATCIALFVSAVVVASSMLGATATGIAAVFPVSLISLIVIVQPRIGAAASALLAATALRAMLGFGLMLLILHHLIPWLGTPMALVAAFLVSSGWSCGLLALKTGLIALKRPGTGCVAP
jgi:hypothetical protein